MKWRKMRRSSNVEDRRGMGGFGFPGGGTGFPGGRGAVLPVGGGLGTLILVALLFFLNGSGLISNGGNPGEAPGAGPAVSGRASAGNNDEARQFVSAVLGDTEDVWSRIFQKNGQRYRPPTLVLFSDRVQSACGVAGSSTGPFYCPADEKLYIDLSFFRDMESQLGASGDFAYAYVIAHEVGHHVQNLTGTLEQTQRLQNRAERSRANQLQVRTELQADFYAGVWAHHASQRNLLDTGDIEEGLNAAAAVGDDRLQQRSQGYVVPDSFTHGSSAQRVQWFRRGLESGDLRQGNTFGDSNNASFR